MKLIQSFILGLIEGLTEFLPVSSTAHLVLFSSLLKISQSEFQKFFEIFIQGGAFLAVVFGYFKFVFKNPQVLKKILISFLPTSILGIVFYKIFKNFLLPNKTLISLSLIFVGILFLVFEKLIQKGKFPLKKGLKEMNFFEAFFIGIVQALSMIPGVSRSGAIILGMMLLGFKRDEAVLYSFLLGALTLISASSFELLQFGARSLFLNQNQFYFLLIGFFTSCFFAFFANRWLLKYLQKHDLKIFGWYRIIIGIIFLSL